MKHVIDILRSIQSTQALSRQFGLSLQLTDLIKAQESWKRNLTGLSMLTDIAKSFKHKPSLDTSFTTAIAGLAKTIAIPKPIPDFPLDAIAKSIAIQRRPQIPNTALEAINAISKQHGNYLTGLKAATASFNPSALTQLKNLQFALTGISGRLAANIAIQKDWDLLDEFEDISEQAIDVASNISQEIGLNEEESRRFEKLVEHILTFIRRNKKFGTNALLFLSVVVNIMALHQYHDFVKPKPAPATQEELKKFQSTLIQTITDKLKEQKEYRTTKRDCKVRLKPATKTLILETLPKDFELIVLQVRHKWVYVSYVSPLDNLPRTGWILKKYTVAIQRASVKL